MKQSRCNEIIKKLIPYVVILGLVIFTEIFVFNFSTWKTMSCEPITLSVDEYTDESGLYDTGYFNINDDVKNVNVDLSVTGYDRANVTVALTDEGDYYVYELPQYEIVPGVEGDGYRNIYPFGKVSTIQITVSVPEGASAHISSIKVNDNRPLDVKILRVGVLFLLISLGYIVFSDGILMKAVCMRGNKYQLLLVAAVMFFVMFVGFLLVKSNPVCVNSPWPHHKQYRELAHAMKQGTVVVDDSPDMALLEKENPYDTIALLAENIPFRMDYAFYNGNYYVYFGIIPELLFFLPHYLLTGQDLQNYIVVFLFYCMMVVGIFGTLWELALHLGKRMPFIFYLILGVSVSLLSNYVFMLGRPDIYNIPIIASNAFVFLGTFFWMRALWTERYTSLCYAAGSFCMACIAGCRPQMLLYVIAIFCALFVPLLLNKEWRKTISWQKAVSFVLPFIAVGAIVFWYNQARFGSGFEFGATYSLTTNDMNHRGFNFSRVFRGLYSFLLQPPVIHSTFPFLESCELDGNYMGKNIVEFCYGGLFAVSPLLLGLLYIPLGGYMHCTKDERRLVSGLCLTSVIIAAFDINAAGILQRYMGDMIFGFLLAAVIVLFGMLDRYRESKIYLWIAKVIYLAVICGLMFSFLVVITSAGGISLEKYNPVLFHWIRTYFDF